MNNSSGFYLRFRLRLLTWINVEIPFPFPETRHFDRTKTTPGSGARSNIVELRVEVSIAAPRMVCGRSAKRKKNNLMTRPGLDIERFGL